ncbi:MAG: GWxTD domain-containing protein [candidate division WOR-3 bacterium]|nr:GWxTD domain-containing protein [candidate division WOR-3 bacterium]
MHAFFTILLTVLTLPGIDFVYTPGIFKGDRGLELRVFLETESEGLTFIKEGETFTAAYSVSVTLKKENKEKGDVWMRKCRGLEYGTSRTFFDTVGVDILSGRYEMTIIVSDLNSQKSTAEESTISIDTLSAFSISSMIPRKYERLISGNTVTNINGISYCFEVYSDRDAILYFTLENYTDSTDITPGITPIRIEPALDTLSGKNAFVSAILQSGEERFIRMDTLFIARTVFTNEKLYKNRVKALAYLTNNNAELDTLLSARPEDRDSVWRAFWKVRDPTPKTAKNELEDEYMARIEYADRYLGGWQMDMGRVWLVMGRPDEIERHPFELDSWAYEVWYYYATNEKFVFYDMHGLGYYELTYPENWNPKRR